MKSKNDGFILLFGFFFGRSQEEEGPPLLFIRLSTPLRRLFFGVFYVIKKVAVAMAAKNTLMEN